MADDDVDVVFGASTEKLEAGFEKINEQIDSLKDHFQELAELVGISFGLEGIKEYIESMAHLGQTTEKIMAQIGTTAEQTVQMSGIAQLTGTSIEGLALSIERMSLNIQRSTRDATNPAALALKALHLNAKDLIGLPASEWFDALHDSVSKFNPSLNLMNALQQIGGRGIAQMMPALQLSAHAWDEMKQRIIGASEGLAEAIPGMAATHENLTIAGEAMTSFGARIFTVLQPALNWAINAFTDFAESLKSKDIKQMALQVVDFVTDAITALADFFSGLSGLIDDALTDMDKFIGKAKAVAGGAVAGGVLGSALGPIGTALGAIGGGEIGAKVYDYLYAPIDDTVDKVNKDTPKWVAQIAATMAKLKASIEGGPGGAEAGPKKQDMGAIGVGAQQAIAQQEQALQAAMHLQDEAYNSTKAHLDAEVQLHQISYAQETEYLKEAISQRLAVDLDLMNNEQAQYAEASAKWDELQQKKLAAAQKSAAEIKALDDKQAKDTAQEWKKVGDEISAAVASQNKQILSGQETVGEAFKNIFADMALKAIAAIEKIIIEDYILKGIEVLLFPPAGLPHYDVGTDMVTQTGAAVVHAGEQIVPAESTGPYSGGIGGGGGGGNTIQFNINAIDAGGVQAFFQTHGAQVARVLQNHLNQPSMSQ